jgi:hypothetical protein
MRTSDSADDTQTPTPLPVESFTTSTTSQWDTVVRADIDGIGLSVVSRYLVCERLVRTFARCGNAVITVLVND